MNDWNKFFQIRKVDEEKRLVYGRLAQEVKDKSGEVMDYELSKPNFLKWIDESEALSKGKSQGNLRAMHGNVAAGKFNQILFSDEEKAVDAVAKVVDNNEWQKVLEGVYTGFSVGGNYGKKWIKDNLTHYEAIPIEGSLVDRPCIPTATFFEIQKSDGSLRKIDFKRKDKGVENMKLTEELKKYLGQEAWDAQQALTAMQSIYGLLAGELSEGHEEAPEQVTALKAAIENLKAFIASELKEKEPEAEAEATPLAMNEPTKDLKKADPEPEPVPEPVPPVEPVPVPDPAPDLAKAGARNSKTDLDKIQKVHDHAVDLGAMCKAEKVDMPAEMQKLDAGLKQAETDLKKIQGERDEALKKSEALTAESVLLKAKIVELEKQPEPAKGIKKAVTITKENDSVEVPLKKLEETEEFKKADEQAKALMKMKEALTQPEFINFAK